MRGREEGGRGLQGERKSNKVMVRYRERGDRGSRGTAGPCEYQIKLVTSLACGERRGVLSQRWQKLVKTWSPSRDSHRETPLVFVSQVFIRRVLTLQLTLIKLAFKYTR